MQSISIECYEDIYRLFTSATQLGLVGVAPGMTFSKAAELWGTPAEHRNDDTTELTGMTWEIPLKLKHGGEEDFANVGVQGRTDAGTISSIQLRVQTCGALLPAVADAIEKRLKSIFGKPTGPKSAKEWTSLPSGGSVSSLLLGRSKRGQSLAIVLGG